MYCVSTKLPVIQLQFSRRPYVFLIPSNIILPLAYKIKIIIMLPLDVETIQIEE